MKRLALFLLLFSIHSNASTWQLRCSGEGYHGKTDRFSAVVDADRKLVSFSTQAKGYPFRIEDEKYSSDLGAIDPLFYDAEISKNLKVLSADVGTYNYFFGSIVMNLGEGLGTMTKDVDFSIVEDNSVVRPISVDYDDGDGFGFDNRAYTCNVTKY